MAERWNSTDASPAVEALVRLAMASGADEDARDLALRLLRELDGDPPDIAELARVAVALDLHPTVREYDLDVALARAGGGRPLLIRIANGSAPGSPQTLGKAGRWVVLLGGRARGLQTEIYGPGEDRAERVIPVHQVADALGLEPSHSVSCLHLEPTSTSRAQEPLSPSHEPLSPHARLLQLFRPDRSDIVAVAIFAVAIGVLLLATPIAVQALVNSVAVGGAIPPLIVVGMLLAIGLVLAGMLSACQAWIVEILQRRLFVRMVADLGARLPRVSLDVYEHRYGPELVNRFFDVITIQKTGSALLLDGLSILLSVVVGLIVLAFYHPLLLAFDIILLVIIGFIVLGPMRRGVRTAIAESQAKYEVAGLLEEVARYPILYRTAGARRFLFERSDRAARNYLERRAAHYRVLFGQIVGALGLHALASTALLVIGGMLVIEGSLTLGQLVAAELIVTIIVNSVAKMGKHLENYYDLIAATDKLGFLLNLPLEPSGGVEHLGLVRSAGAVLHLRGVRCQRALGTSLFEDISVQVDAQQSLGVCGPAGAGKSTLLEMIWGLRRPDRGVIRLDEHDLRDLPVDEMRRASILVAEIEIVSGTIRQNVQLGRDVVSDQNVRTALDRVGLLERFEALPDGLETEVGARGWPLSEGELRCLQVARAIVDPPRLLMVSEVFLELSGQFRDRLLDTLFAPDGGWTLVVVSNGPDVLGRCTQVLELPSGIVRPGRIEVGAP